MEDRWITMVARDLAPSRAFEMMKAKLEDRGVRVAPYLGGGKPLPGSMSQIVSDIANSKLLLLGMSSSAELAKEEVEAAGIAMENGVPFGFYADIFGTSSRAWFAPFREKANFVFVLSEVEAEMTRKLFPNAEVIATGNPVIESSFWPAKSALVTRRTLGVVDDSDLLLYCTAGKDLEVNRLHFKAVVDAVSSLWDRKIFKIFFMLHPGDQNIPSAYEDAIRAEGVQARLMQGKDIKAIGFSSLDVIGACDLMVAAASTSGIEAACLRKPVIDFFSPPGLKRMKEQTGSDTWPPCEFGISRPAFCASHIANAIPDLLGGGFSEMRAKQEAYFPTPAEPGQAVRKMTASLLQILG